MGPPATESCTGPRIVTRHEGRKRRRSLGARRRHRKRGHGGRFSAERARRGHRVVGVCGVGRLADGWVRTHMILAGDSLSDLHADFFT